MNIKHALSFTKKTSNDNERRLCRLITAIKSANLTPYFSNSVMTAVLLGLALPLNAAQADIQQFRQGENSYTGASDTYITHNYPRSNFGHQSRIKSYGQATLGLLYWDLQSIPAGARIDSVSMTVQVTNPSRESYDLYAMQQPWSEGTANWASLHTGAFGTQKLGTLTAKAQGNFTIQLNADGIAVVQSWIQGNPNYGFVLAGNSTSKDDLNIVSKEAKRFNLRPKLDIVYTAGSVTPPPPVLLPTATPTTNPTSSPTPTIAPTAIPTVPPTATPVSTVTPNPTVTPTLRPTATPIATTAPTPTPTGTPAKTTIDVMVLYTTNNQTQAYAKQRLNLLVTATNQAYKDSFIDLQIRLVHTEPTSYGDSKTNNTALDDLTNGAGVFSNVAALRTQYGADLVNLFRPYDYSFGNCGLAWLGMNNGSAANKNDGFSVVSDGSDKSGSNYYCDDTTFAHELGHNMGLEHERENAIGSKPIYPYAYAWGINGTFGTIMGYDSPSLNYFSTPLLPTQCAGTPCGYPKSDAARGSDQSSVINYTAPFISTFLPTTTVSPVLQ